MVGDALYRVSPDGLSVKVPAVSTCVGNVAVGAGGAAWVTDIYFPSRVLRVDTTTLKVVARVPLAFTPGDIAADAEGVWVLDRRGKSAVRIDPRTNRVAGKVRVGDGPVSVAAGAGAVWVANVDSGTVSRIDASTGRVVATIKVGPNPAEIAVGEGGVWVIVRGR